MGVTLRVVPLCPPVGGRGQVARDPDPSLFQCRRSTVMDSSEGQEETDDPIRHADKWGRSKRKIWSDDG